MHIKYLIFVSVWLIVILVVVLGINFYADPLNNLRANTKTYFSSERNLKSRMIEQKKYSGIVMGSSKSAYIQPEDINLSGEILNASFSGALPEEILYFLKDKKPNVRWLAVGFDWFMFNENSSPYVSNNAFRSNTIDDTAQYLFSLDTFIYSIRSYVNWLMDKPVRYTIYGARASKDLEKKDRMKETYNFSNVLMELKKNHFSNYRISTRRLEDVSKIQKFADENNILLVSWIQPFHEATMSMMRDTIYEEGLSLPIELNNRLDKFIDLSERYPSKEMFFKNDPYHFLPSTGSMFFNKDIVPLLQ